MRNEYYTIFGLKAGAPVWMEELIIETTDVSKAYQAKQEAEKNGYKITRIYKPDTILDMPKFM